MSPAVVTLSLPTVIRMATEIVTVHWPLSGEFPLKMAVHDGWELGARSSPLFVCFYTYIYVYVRVRTQQNQTACCTDKMHHH